MIPPTNIIGKIAELGGAAALVYLASFVYGFLELQAYYSAFGLKWYIPFLPTNYFSMHSAATMSGVMLLTLAYGASLKIISSSVLEKIVITVILSYLVLLILATFVMREKNYQLASEAMNVCNLIMFPSTHIISLGVALILVKHTEFLKRKTLGVCLILSTIMIFYAAPSLRGEARAIEVMRNYGSNLPSLSIDSKTWSLLTIFEDKALAINFPKELESHPIATIISIDKNPIKFDSPGYIGDGYLKND